MRVIRAIYAAAIFISAAVSLPVDEVVDASNGTDFNQLHSSGTIPFAEIGCYQDPRTKLVMADVVEAKRRAVAAFRTGRRKIEPKNFYMKVVNDAAWLVCNCKVLWRDGIPAPELDEVVELLTERCGEGYNGWVYSRAWDKCYIVDSYRRLLNMEYQDWCPPGCVNARK